MLCLMNKLTRMCFRCFKPSSELTLRIYMYIVVWVICIIMTRYDNSLFVSYLYISKKKSVVLSFSDVGWHKTHVFLIVRVFGEWLIQNIFLVYNIIIPLLGPQKDFSRQLAVYTKNVIEIREVTIFVFLWRRVCAFIHFLKCYVFECLCLWIIVCICIYLILSLYIASYLYILKRGMYVCTSM